MKISISDQKKYPNFTKYVRRQLPKLKGVPKVIRNLNNSGHLDEKEAASALTWGNLPLIRITDLHSGQCGVPKAYGCFRHKNKGRIEIHTQIVKAKLYTLWVLHYCMNYVIGAIIITRPV